MFNLPPHLAHITLKDLLKPPFLPCPQCGNEALGVMAIGNHQYSRRCFMCGVAKRYPLPRLTKKIIYLDQFVISNMAKQLDPNTPKSKQGDHAKFFVDLFETLDRVCKLQLAVCPESPIHEHESVVTGPHFENLRQVYRHLSYEVRFRSPDQVLHHQVITAYQSWLAEAPTKFPGERSVALDGNIDDWTNWLRIDLNYILPGLPKALDATKSARTKHLHGVCSAWQGEPDFSFKAVFENELRGFGEITVNKYLRHLTKFDMALRGELDVSEIAFHPPEVSLMQSLLRLSEANSRNPQDQINVIRVFFESKVFRKVPYVKVWALFWATLARVVRSGMNPEKFPSGSLYNDLEVIAAYSPYCDVMFVDKEMENLTRQGDLGRCLSSGARIFSLRSKEDFLEYLKKLEADASPDHIALTKEVYGPDAGTPFRSLLTWDKKKSESKDASPD